MTCRDATEFLDSYVTGELPAAQTRLFDEHLQQCASCRNYLASYRLTVRLGNSLLAAEDDTNDLPIPEELVQAILAARKV